MFFHGASLMLALFAFSQLQMVISDCPLNLNHLNFTLAASVCSKHDRGKCCRYINAFLAVSIAWYANATGQLGVPLELSESCLNSVSETLQLYGIPSNATAFCGLGTKIPVNYQCKGKKTVVEMMHSPKFDDVILNCKFPFSAEDGCRGCITAEISYLRQLVGTDGNTTFSTCRDATFVTLASQLDNLLTIDMASCFFGIPGFSVLPAVISDPPSQPPTPEVSPIPVSASSPSQHLTYIPSRDHRRPYHLTIIPVVGILVTGVALLLLIILILLIHRKSRELKGSKSPDQIWNGFQPRWQNRKSLEGPSCMFRRFSYKETKKATGNFCSVIGRGGFGTVYKAQFGDDFAAAVKRMNKVSEQGEDAFCREMELLGRLHHRHLVVLRGFCVAKHERFLMYEYMGNGTLKDHLHSPGKAPLSWQTRIQIAIDVANALEYLHFYCDPPLCHRDIKSSNILLDDKFVAKVADFGLAHAVGSGAISFEPVNTDIRGTPGYMDPEYVVTQELTEKSDIYSYGVLLLELVTARKAIQENRNLVEWSQIFMLTPSRLHEMVDPLISDSYDLEQLQTVASIVRWCTQREGTARPSIKQILRLLHERLDRVDSDLAHAFEDEGAGGIESGTKGKEQRCELILHSGEARGLQSSSSTSRSFCSKSFLLETSSSP